MVKKLWKFIWAMKLPAMVKVFAWKAVKDILPMRSNLNKKKVEADEECPFWHANSEDVLHALVFCPSNREVWELFFPMQLQTNGYGCFIDVALEISQRPERDSLERFFLICWTYWYKRNLKLFENKELNSTKVFDSVAAMQKSFQESRGKPLMEVRHHCRWEFPPPGVFKLNVDGAFSRDGSRAAIGVVIRDSSGVVIMSVTKRELATMNILEIEGLTILRGLQFSMHLGIHHLIIESDSLLVINEFQNTEDSNAIFGNVIKEAKRLIEQCHSCVCQHIHRSSNFTAHTLAKLGLCVPEISLWWGSHPDVIY